jgi:uncharacterized membrane protein YccC
MVMAALAITVGSIIGVAIALFVAGIWRALRDEP